MRPPFRAGAALAPRAAMLAAGLSALAATVAITRASDPPPAPPAPAPPPVVRPSMTTLRLRMGQMANVALYAPAMSRPDLHPVIFFVGDWGWRPLQQETASSLALEGRFVLGIDSTEYFKRPLEPADWATDLKRLRDFTNEKAGRPAGSPVLLVGYQWGGEVIPYMLNRGGATGFAGALLIGPNHKSAFVYRVSIQMDNVPSPPEESFDTGDELKRLPQGFPVAFIEGELDKTSEARDLEPLVRGPHRLATVPGGDRQFHEVRDIFFSRLSQGLAWLESQSRLP